MKDDFIRSGMDELRGEGGPFPDDDFLGEGSSDGDDFGLGEFGDFGEEGSDDLEEGPTEIDFDSAGGTEDFDGPEANVQVEPKEKKSVLRGAKYGLIFLGVALVLVLVGIRLVNWLGTRETGAQEPASTPVNIEDVGGIEGTGQEDATNSQNAQASDGTASRPQGSTVSEGWIWVEPSSELEFSKPIQGVFTVTNIKYVSKVVEAKKTLQLKAVLTGSIDGVYGTYEADVPYDKALSLEVGTKLYITYSIAEKNGVQYIGGISF